MTILIKQICTGQTSWVFPLQEFSTITYHINFALHPTAKQKQKQKPQTPTHKNIMYRGLL